MEPVLLKIDCVSLHVSDLDSAIEFYSTRLGHSLLWKTPVMAGLSFPRGDAELVLHTDARPSEAEFLVPSVPEAVGHFTKAGGQVIVEPFEIQIGFCAVLGDPWGNRIVILDMSKGPLKVDPDKNVVP